VVEGVRGLEFAGVSRTVPRPELEAMRSWMESDRRRNGLPWPAYLKRNWPRIYAKALEIHTVQVEAPPQMKNNDGDEFILSKAIYRIAKGVKLIESLRTAADLDEAEKGAHYVWLRGRADDPDNTVLGDIRLSGRELILECNSRERLAQGKKLLAKLAGPAIQFQKDEFQTQEELMRKMKDRPAEDHPPKDDISPELEAQVVGGYMEQYYAKWPDMKIPALDGKTPREAVKSEMGRRKVAELLKDIENQENQNRRDGRYAYDVSKLRDELGIKR
jgi:hypothetical protein